MYCGQYAFTSKVTYIVSQLNCRTFCAGFMYIRYTQPPADLFDWYADYLDDEEEIDPRAGGGGTSTIGALVRQMLIKLDWFSTLFPRIPVPIQKLIEQK